MSAAILTMEIETERDVVLARQRARQVAALLGFDLHDQTRIATAVSETARHAFHAGGAGHIQFSIDSGRSLLVISLRDADPDVQGAPDPGDGATTGIVAARRLMDEFDVKIEPGDARRIWLGKHLPRAAGRPTPERLAFIAGELARQRPADPLDEIQQQNKELVRTLVELRSQKAALAQANRELEETNRGVVALYAELDERADYLQRANEIKVRFLSNMTHEFRTPINSILSLSRILLQRLDGDLSPEQEKQVRFIERSADALSELVDDLLDLGKAEAGKIVVHPSHFEVGALFATLRGMLRPMLAQNASIELYFEEPEGVPAMFTDESKVSQILRNFVSNAIKYTERGEVRVHARPRPDGNVVFSVSDTGIGIAAEHLERIFQEYTQIESPLQHRIKGTGLGLPLARRLAELLGGSVGVASEPDKGSTFYAVIPAVFEPDKQPAPAEVRYAVDPERTPVLFVEDNPEMLLIYEKLLQGTRYQLLAARSLDEARACLRTLQPAAIVLDILLKNENSWGFIGQVRRSARDSELPIIVVTVIEDQKRALALGADAFHAKPVSRTWLREALDQLTSGERRSTVLVTDDDEVSRYLLRSLLSDEGFHVVEAGTGHECLYYARNVRPRAIVLDLLMPGLDGFAVLEELKSDPELDEIPVIVHTAKPLDDAERARLKRAAAIVPKQNASHEAARRSLQEALDAAGIRPRLPAREIREEHRA